MKKSLLALGIILITTASSTISVSAGSLNAYENEVISAAKSIYEYNGVKYKVDQSYIDQLTNYLSSDGIDLTAEQRDEVIQLAYANIEQGVKDGYLIPIEEQEDNQSTSEDSDKVTQLEEKDDTSKLDESHNESSQEITSSEKTINSNPSDSNIPFSDTNGDSTNSKEVTPKEMIDQIIKGEQIKQTKGDTSIDVEAVNTEPVNSNIIKNTGFDLTNTLLTCIAIGVLMLGTFLVSIKYNQFAHDDE